MAVSQSCAMARCARARLTWPSQTAWCSASSTESFGFGTGPASGHRLAASLAPPQFQRHQVVKLAAGARRQAVSGIGLAGLECLGLAFPRPDGVGVAGDADRGLDVGLGHRRVDRPGRAAPVREATVIAGLARPGQDAGHQARVVHLG